MADIFSKFKRSEIMSHISGKETKPEIMVRKFLFKHGFRFRKNVDTLPGKPDIVLPKYKIIIFVHGCFWHGHSRCKAAKLPTTRKKFWEEKIGANRIRDKRIYSKLRYQGYHIITIWQCKIKSQQKREKTLEGVLNKLKILV